jgi:hypothetical protein
VLDRRDPFDDLGDRPMNRKRRISPSLITSTPAPSCIAITWSTARSSIRLKSGSANWPCSNAARASFR